MRRSPIRRMSSNTPRGLAPVLPAPRGKRSGAPALPRGSAGLASGTGAPPERDDDGGSADTQPGMPASMLEDTQRMILEPPGAVVVDDEPPRLPGNYRLLEPIAAGGMGVVYRARHLHLDREVAIKLAHESLLDGEVLDRFSREASATAAIGHPGVAQVHDFGYTPRGRPYLVLEYLEGESLASRLGRSGPLSPLQASAVAADVAEVLAAAHAAGVVHRDLSPPNIFLAQRHDGVQVKVLDFGVAKLTADDGGRHTLDDRLLGTPSYMAPEQSVNPSLADHRSDIYALGCVLYEMLTGRPPFVGGLSEVLDAQRFRPPDEAPLAGAPAPLRALVLSMLAKSARGRPATMAEVAERLRRIGASRICYFRGSEETGKVPRRSARPTRWSLGLAVTVVLAGTAVLFLLASGLVG
jgi:eukaryotic-like serine/threonine-protein kinase